MYRKDDVNAFFSIKTNFSVYLICIKWYDFTGVSKKYGNVLMKAMFVPLKIKSLS